MHKPLETAIAAAHAAGELLRTHFGEPLQVDKFEAHDIKLELDVRTQDLITRLLLTAFPDHALYGEEGIAGNQESDHHWIVDPIDGTVNYFYGIPHFCISIALRRGTEMQLGVIYDPMRNELWQAVRGEAPLLNGKPMRVSTRAKLSEAVVSIGMSKSSTTISTGVPVLATYAQRVRKTRLMGSAALDLAYVACGRLDAYIEQSVSLWDIAAGQLLVETAGGKIEVTPRPEHPGKLSVIATNGVLDLTLD
jgi:myo-inositol-1(or 4)-monophosphatase